MEQQDFLQDIELDAYSERASVGMRFLNGLVDGLVIRVIDYAMERIMILFGISIFSSFYGMGIWTLYAIGYLFGLILNFVYYTISEGSTKGRTIGKFVTSTRVVMNDGSAITWQTAALRSLCRMVPFEALSAFSGNPWHDQWTNTQVVKVRR